VDAVPGYEVVETSLPVVITVSNELGEARYPTIKGIMTAKKIEPIVWKPADIGVTPAQIGEGITVWTATAEVTGAQKGYASASWALWAKRSTLMTRNTWIWPRR
jgi:electron transfer flavoprotein alpha/beta subunit